MLRLRQPESRPSMGLTTRESIAQEPTTCSDTRYTGKDNPRNYRARIPGCHSRREGCRVHSGSVPAPETVLPQSLKGKRHAKLQERSRWYGIDQVSSAKWLRATSKSFIAWTRLLPSFSSVRARIICSRLHSGSASLTSRMLRSLMSAGLPFVV